MESPQPAERRIELRHESWLHYWPTFLSAEEGAEVFATLRAETPWEELSILVFERPVKQPRLIAWAGDLAYRYSGLVLHPRAPSATVARLLALVNERCGEAFNHVLLNLYRSGADRVSFHSDAEPELGRNPQVASLSLGVARRFELKPRRGAARRKISLQHGSLLLMGGACQRHYRHAVPPQPTVEGERINVTFRRLLRPPDPRPWDEELIHAR